jgi:hypothetical protein
MIKPFGLLMDEFLTLELLLLMPLEGSKIMQALYIQEVLTNQTMEMVL